MNLPHYNIFITKLHHALFELQHITIEISVSYFLIIIHYY